MVLEPSELVYPDQALDNPSELQLAFLGWNKSCFHLLYATRLRSSMGSNHIAGEQVTGESSPLPNPGKAVKGNFYGQALKGKRLLCSEPCMAVRKIWSHCCKNRAVTSRWEAKRSRANHGRLGSGWSKRCRLGRLLELSAPSLTPHFSHHWLQLTCKPSENKSRILLI